MADPTNKEISEQIDSLAQSVAGGFSSVEERLERIEQSLKDHDARLVEVEKRLGTVERKMDYVTDTLLGDHQQRIQQLEQMIRK